LNLLGVLRKGLIDIEYLLLRLNLDDEAIYRRPPGHLGRDMLLDAVVLDAKRTEVPSNVHLPTEKRLQGRIFLPECGFLFDKKLAVVPLLEEIGRALRLGADQMKPGEKESFEETHGKPPF
jgi:hypothetical protein